MIEGARQLPWLWLTASADPGSPLLDCTSCRRHRDVEERQEMGCGYEERIAPEHEVALWVHPGFPVRLLPRCPVCGGEGALAGGARCEACHGRGGRPSTCVGYTAKLPAVTAIASLGIHWERGTLLARLGGAAPQLVFDVLEEIEAQRNAAEAWRLAQLAPPGGR